jgi:predicted nicotinamide N-methyase
VTVTDTKTVRGLTVFKNKSKEIKKLLDLNNDPEIHGHKIWYSSFFIIDYLDANPPKKKSNIMEVGCGWGILSIYCAKNFKAQVTGVDADENVFPFLKLHARANGVKVKKSIARYENLKRNTLAKQDLIVGGDICFWKELVDPLYKMINKAVKAGVPRIIIADPGRSPFLKLAKRCVKHFDAELIEVDISKPRKKEGYLLIIEN